MDFQVMVERGNSAFTDYPEDEICRILEDIKRKISSGIDGGVIMDINGNRVGDWFFDTEN